MPVRRRRVVARPTQVKRRCDLGSGVAVSAPAGSSRTKRRFRRCRAIVRPRGGDGPGYASSSAETPDDEPEIVHWLPSPSTDIIVDTASRLLYQVRRKQLLVCAYRTMEDPFVCTPVTLADISSLLNLRSTECLHLVERLQLKGLVEPVPDAGFGAFRLTQRGRRLVLRMSPARLPTATL